MSYIVLKWIACISMLIDHVTYLFIDHEAYANAYMLGRGIGRLALPIFCFLIVEGFYHTSDFKRYALRLAICAVIAEPAYDFFWSGFTMDALYRQNVLWTLLLGLCMVRLIDRLQIQYAKHMVQYNIFACLAVVAASLFAIFAHLEYNAYAVLIVVAFYIFRGSKLLLAILLFLLTSMFYPTGSLQYLAVLALIPIAFYKGEKGTCGKRLQYGFYVFYPVHLFVLAFLARIL